MPALTSPSWTLPAADAMARPPATIVPAVSAPPWANNVAWIPALTAPTESPATPLKRAFWRTLVAPLTESVPVVDARRLPAVRVPAMATGPAIGVSEVALKIAFGLNVPPICPPSASIEKFAR